MSWNNGEKNNGWCYLLKRLYELFELNPYALYYVSDCCSIPSIILVKSNDMIMTILRCLCLLFESMNLQQNFFFCVLSFFIMKATLINM